MYFIIFTPLVEFMAQTTSRYHAISIAQSLNKTSKSDDYAVKLLVDGTFELIEV